MIHKKIEQSLREAVSYNMEIMVDRALLCANDLGNSARPHFYHVFNQVGYAIYNKVHAGVYNPIRDLFQFHLWPSIRAAIFLNEHHENT